MTSLDSLEKENCHIHLTGALKPENLRLIGHAAGVSLTCFEPMEEHVNFEHLEIWAAAKELTSTQAGLLMAISKVTDLERESNVRYIELTLNPSGMLRRGLELDKLLDSLICAADYAMSVGVILKYKFGVNRKDGPSSFGEVTRVFRECPREIRIAVDLNGDECKYPTALFADALSIAKQDGIPLTVHAGEFSSLRDSLEDAIRITPQRIAHAIAASRNHKILTEIKQRGIVVEVAPTSNLLRRAVISMREHPITEFLDYGIPVVIGSDDPGFFDTNMTLELLQLEAAGLGIRDIKALCIHQAVPKATN